MNTQEAAAAARVGDGARMPRELPGGRFLGHLRRLRRDPLSLVLEAARAADMTSLRVGPRRLVVTGSPELAQAVLLDHADAFEKTPELRNATAPLIGSGLITSEGELHRRQRKMISGVFQPRRIDAYADGMVSCSAAAASRWAEGQTLELGREMLELTLAIDGRVLFSANLLEHAGDLNGLHSDLTYLQRWASAEVTRIVHLPNSWPLPRNVRARRAMARLDAIVYRLIEERRRTAASERDLLAVLLDARDEDGATMSDQQARDEAMTLLIVGHETTATTLAWAWHLLASNPAVYDRLLNEIDTQLGLRPAGLGDLPKMPFSLQVVKETLRIRPTAWIMVRVARRDMRVGPYDIPEGTYIAVSPWSMHHDRRYFPDPETFDPTRFAPEREEQLPRYAYIPFGGGPRICIGNHMALLEVQLALITIAQQARFELLPDQRIVLEPSITLRSRDGIRVRVQRRAPAGAA